MQWFLLFFFYASGSCVDTLHYPTGLYNSKGSNNISLVSSNFEFRLIYVISLHLHSNFFNLNARALYFPILQVENLRAREWLI